MVVMVLVIMAVFAAAVMFLWSKLDAEPAKKADGESGCGGPETAATTLEGALVAQLVSGEINRSQYQAAQARLAARDAERNPMSVPRDDRPDACA